MGDGAEDVEAEEPGCALDGVDGAKDAGNQLFVGWIFLEFDDLLIEDAEIFIALDQKFPDFFGKFHAKPSLPAHRDDRAFARSRVALRRVVRSGIQAQYPVAVSRIGKEEQRE
jgi:hypothetical protein